MKRNILYILGMACMMTACLDEPFVNYEPTPGVEVQFSGNLNQTQTRTLYGQESGNKVPVHWVHGDTISVYGTTCLSGRKQADYTVNTIDPNGTSGQPEAGNDFAFSLDKVGAYGVQWGEQSASDFYAIYPSTKGTFSEVDGKVTVTTNIRSAQKNRFIQKVVGKKEKFPEVDSIVWEGVPYINDLNNPTMRDALMYAYTSKANSTAQVDLKFHPFSTVLKFHIKGWTGEGISTGLEATVSKIILQAPEGVGIAGDCTFTFNAGEPTASNGTSRTITVYPDYLPMGEQEAVEFHVFAIPHTNQMALNEDWTVTIETSNFGNHTFKLKPKEGTNATLLPRKIHKINVPLKHVSMMDEIELPNQNWMEYVPRNVYVSELSVPGSWYSNHSSYQGSADINAQFAAGIRAFHLDCRLNFKTAQASTTYGASTTLDQLQLTAAGPEENGGTMIGVGNFGYLAGYNPGKTLSEVMGTIATLAASKPKEYVVVVLTIAEKPVTRKDMGSSNKMLGTVNPSIVLPEIYKLLDAKKDEWKLYYKKNVSSDPSKPQYVYGIDENTTINDILTNGNIIVKINVNAVAGSFVSYGSGPAMVSEASMASEQEFINAPIVKGTFTKMNSSKIYWGDTMTNLTYYHHAAQKTDSDTERGVSVDNVTIPTIGMRMDAIDDIIEKSQTIYNTSAHNGWYQIALGGYDADDDDDHETVARKLNAYLKEWVDAKIAKETRNGVVLQPSPVGVVLMNHSTSANKSETSGNGNGKGLIQSIIALNTKFTMERNPNQPEWPDGKNPYEDLFNQMQPSQTAAYAEVGEDVF